MSKPIPTPQADLQDLAWRAGKPAEDPEKMKRWGFVTAMPSEYLIHMRRGKIRRRSTGQGASCFKWPWDSVAIIPTTINRLQFTADQVTLEKVGVQITGLAVYRIVEPELTFRMLNFSYSERASEKLGEILQEMFVGATRRLVANLSIEDTMTRRKEAIAHELLVELAPVVEGRGRGDDSTATGWGVVIDTVEVQNVRVLSETVFSEMQARFRAELTMRARQAELESAREIATREAEATRQIAEARLAGETATRELRAQSESHATEIEVTEQIKREQLQAHAAVRHEHKEGERPRREGERAARDGPRCAQVAEHRHRVHEGRDRRRAHRAGLRRRVRRAVGVAAQRRSAVRRGARRRPAGARCAGRQRSAGAGAAGCTIAAAALKLR